MEKEKFKNKQNFRKVMKSKLLIIILMSFLFSFILFTQVSAYQVEELGEFEQNSEIRLVQICDNAEFINISSVSYPNSTNAIESVEMNYSGNGEYYYNFNKTSEVGTYHVRGISDGCEKNFVYTFDIYPEDKGIFDFDVNTFTIVLFVVLVLLAIGLFVYGQVVGSAVTFIILGFLTLVNEINLIISIILIIIGIVVLTLDNKNG